MDKAQLFAPSLPQDTVELSGGSVTVRGLSRYESAMTRVGDPDQFTMEKRILRFGMVEPALTEDEAGQWLRAATFDALEPVLMRIAELSGLVEGAAKSGLAGTGSEPGTGV